MKKIIFKLPREDFDAVEKATKLLAKQKVIVTNITILQIDDETGEVKEW